MCEDVPKKDGSGKGRGSLEKVAMGSREREKEGINRVSALPCGSGLTVTY